MTSDALLVPSAPPADVVDGAYVVVDVRSPREFAEGHMPGAVNLPLLGDEERARVGTAYRHTGAHDARMAAVDVISARLPTYLRTLRALSSEGRRVAVMCWRGGERSRNVVLLLSLVGVRAVQVAGGYKAYRRWVLDGLGSWEPDRPVFTLFGLTGAGKTALLRALGDVERGGLRPWVIDLEGLALHRGSLLGGLNQPGRRTQKDFDALVFDALRHPRGDYLVIEGEGGKIGRLFLPETVAALVREGTPVLVDAPVEDRAARLMEEYAPAMWDTYERAAFLASLASIGGRKGPAFAERVREAFESARYEEVVGELLVDYYDPLYRSSSVEGRDFALVFETSADIGSDAERLAARLEPLAARLEPPAGG